ncbi:DUF2892 domain-containing protein [Candidatus Woesearchaeota archaeon]|nr:MAG: DUF2892 domain-containing protein [Candidatus Woesearchaeota archaeon]
MKSENAIRVIAGGLVFTTALLGYLHHKYWLFATMFVGLNLFQFGFTNWCLMKTILEKLGVVEA